MRKRIAALPLALGLVPAQAMAQLELGSGLSITGTAAAMSDYVFRNISQTRNRPAIQGSLELSHESGFYIGTFASSVAFAGTNARQELDLAGGWRHAAGDITIDIGGVWYTYPNYSAGPGQHDIDFAEAILRLKYQLDPVTFTGTAAWSPDFWGRSGDGYYLEGGVDVAVPVIGVTLSGRIGHQWIERNARFGTPDYFLYSIYASRPIAGGIAATLGWYGTNISQSECGGLKICDSRFIASVSWTF